jgi:tRNA threonylcarbamoyladenosine biosynthesis protein TsaE
MTYTYTLANINEAAQFLVQHAPEKVWRLEGAIGAGKTTLIKAICQQLGVQEVVSSPTFALVNEYRSAANQTIFHFDFYRINSLREAEDMGAEDYFYSGNLCLIEWAENVAALLPTEQAIISISTNPDNSRTLSLTRTPIA